MHTGRTYIIDYGNTAELWQSPGSRGRQAGNPIPCWPDILVFVAPHCIGREKSVAREGGQHTTWLSRDITSIELKHDRCYRTPSISHPFRATRSSEIRFRNTSSLTDIFNLNSRWSLNKHSVNQHSCLIIRHLIIRVWLFSIFFYLNILTIGDSLSLSAPQEKMPTYTRTSGKYANRGV